MLGAPHNQKSGALSCILFLYGKNIVCSQDYYDYKGIEIKKISYALQDKFAELFSAILNKMSKSKKVYKVLNFDEI